MSAPPFTQYQKRLMVFLSVATFFEGFDFFALAQILPSVRAEFGLNQAAAGWLVALINVGPVLAYLLVRQADRWGRRPLLTLTIAGYTVASLLSGLAPTVSLFAASQLLARAFLIGEWAVAMIYAAEEFPADRRGFVLGVIQACASLGAVVCAGVVPLLLQTPFGWRGVFFVGAVPLVIVAFARRTLSETRRFTERATVPVADQRLMRIWSTPWRGRVLLMAAIWGSTYVCTTTAMMFWKEFAVTERNFTDAQVGASMTVAALVSMPLTFYTGRLLDRMGRHRAAVVIFSLTSLSVVASYTLESHAALTAALVVGIFGTTAVLPILNAYTTELFPTELRSDAFAWANNLMGRMGAVLAPLAVGAAAGHLGWGVAISLTALGPLVALALILTRLPETRGQELEQSSGFDH